MEFKKSCLCKKEKGTTRNELLKKIPRHYFEDNARNLEGDPSSNTNERISKLQKLPVSKTKKNKRRRSVTFALPNDIAEEEEENVDQLSSGDAEKVGSSSSVFKLTDIESTANAPTSIHKPKKFRSALKRKKKKKGSHDINSSKENALPLLKYTTSPKYSTGKDVVLMFVGSGVKHLIEIGR